MSVATIVLLVIVFVAIVVVALSLISLATSLLRTASNLSKVNAEIDAIPGKTQPVEQIVDSMRKDLTEAQNALEGVLAKPRH